MHAGLPLLSARSTDDSQDVTGGRAQRTGNLSGVIASICHLHDFLAARTTLKESDDVGESLTADRRKKATMKARSGQGDRGDR
jgi:hypothetical protein